MRKPNQPAPKPIMGYRDAPALLLKGVQWFFSVSQLHFPTVSVCFLAAFGLVIKRFSDEAIPANTYLRMHREGYGFFADLVADWASPPSVLQSKSTHLEYTDGTSSPLRFVEDPVQPPEPAVPNSMLLGIYCGLLPLTEILFGWRLTLGVVVLSMLAGPMYEEHFYGSDHWWETYVDRCCGSRTYTTMIGACFALLCAYAANRVIVFVLFALYIYVLATLMGVDVLYNAMKRNDISFHYSIMAYHAAWMLRSFVIMSMVPLASNAPYSTGTTIFAIALYLSISLGASADNAKNMEVLREGTTRVGSSYSPFAFHSLTFGDSDNAACVQSCERMSEEWRLKKDSRGCVAFEPTWVGRKRLFNQCYDPKDECSALCPTRGLFGASQDTSTVSAKKLPLPLKPVFGPPKPTPP